MHKARSALATLLTPCIAALLLTACTPPPDEDRYAIAVGSDKDFAGLEMRSIFIVTAAENEPGRVLGTIFNKTDENIELIIGDSDDELPVNIPAGERLNSRICRLSSAAQKPGQARGRT